MASYQIYYRDPYGNLLEVIQAFTRLEWVRKENEVGVMSFTMPRMLDKSYLRPDARLEIWRTEGAYTGLVGNTTWFIQDWELSSQQMTITAYDANWLLSGRIVAYAAGTTNAGCLASAADDAIKTVVRSNLSTDSTSDRDLSAYLSLEPALSLSSVSITKEYSRRNVLTVCQEIATEAREGGDYLSFDIEYSGATSLIFKTYLGQRGINHGSNSLIPVILSEKFKNLESVIYTESHASEKTFVYAGGQGMKEERIIETAEDTTRSGRSPFGRREGWIDARMASSTAGVQAEANAELEARRPRKMITGKIVENEGTRFMIHYDFGDLVTAQFEEYSFDAHIDAIHGTYENGFETLDNRIVGYL